MVKCKTLGARVLDAILCCCPEHVVSLVTIETQTSSQHEYLWEFDEDQLNTKCNNANDPLKVPIGSIIRARSKKLK
jgi:hypothetical protein